MSSEVLKFPWGQRVRLVILFLNVTVLFFFFWPSLSTIDFHLFLVWYVTTLEAALRKGLRDWQAGELAQG